MYIFKEWSHAWSLRFATAHRLQDLMAGVVVAVLVIPQSLAYALLAGLPPQAGLYASIFPVVAYALFGSSMTQSVGPVAITAIMTWSVLNPLATPGSELYLSLAATLALMSGVLVWAFGAVRMGFLAQLLSRPVVSGFISGSALLIVLSQCKFLLGVQASGTHTWAVVQSLGANLPNANTTTVAMGGSALLVLLASKRWLAQGLLRVGASHTMAQFCVRIVPLLVVLVAAVLVVAGDLDERRAVAVVGVVHVEGSAYHWHVPSLSELKSLLVPALILAFVGMVQNISMAQALAIPRNEKVDPDRELVGLGIANVVASAYGGMPVGGGLSRTAINVAAGARTPLSSVVTALVMLVMVSLGIQWVERLPLTVLAASIVVAAIGMVDLQTLREAWAYDRADAWAWLGTAAGVVLLGLETGIGLGVALSLATLLLRASTPHIAVVGRIAGTEHFRNVERHGVETIPGVLLLRIDESLFFGNMQAVEERLNAELRMASGARDVVLLMSSVNRIDTTAMQVLADIHRELTASGMRLHMAEIKGPVQDRLMCSPLWPCLEGRVYLSAYAAFVALRSQTK